MSELALHRARTRRRRPLAPWELAVLCITFMLIVGSGAGAYTAIVRASHGELGWATLGAGEVALCWWLLRSLWWQWTVQIIRDWWES